MVRLLHLWDELDELVVYSRFFTQGLRSLLK